MESVNDVKHALSARSRTATLEQLASEGRKRVRLIKAEHVAALITAAVHSAVEESGLIPKEDVQRLIERSRDEFRGLMRDRQAEVERVHQLEEELRQRDEEIAQLRAQVASGSAIGTTGGVAAAGAAGAAATPDVTAALTKLAGSLNDRLEQLGRKMGISSAVEGESVNFDGLFKDTGKELESNMENIQVKKKAGGGIAANLERLKKLKGGG